MSNITNEDGSIDVSMLEPKTPKYARIFLDATDNRIKMKYPDGTLIDVTWVYAYNDWHKQSYIHNSDLIQHYSKQLTTKQDVQNQIKDLESKINQTSDDNEKRNLESQRDSLKQQLENL